jgi:hypothetical protein
MSGAARARYRLSAHPATPDNFEKTRLVTLVIQEIPGYQL